MEKKKLMKTENYEDAPRSAITEAEFRDHTALALEDCFNGNVSADGDRIEVRFNTGEKFEIKVTKIA